MAHEIYESEKNKLSIIKHYDGTGTKYDLHFGETSETFDKETLLKELTAMIRAVGGRKYQLKND